MAVIDRFYKFIRFWGRLVFITLLVTHAIFNIKEPSINSQLFQQEYENIRGLSQSIKTVTPCIKSIQPHIEDLVRIIGVFQGLTAMMIFFGDKIGGILFLIHLIFYTAGVYANQIKNGLNFGNFSEIFGPITLFGFALVLIDSSKSTRHHPVQLSKKRVKD